MKDHIAHSGAWGLALIIIVIASWLLYRYLAPKTWKEWASAGVVQAFIIALYAEMYGFPLTIYLLVRFLGLDQINLNASLWSTLLGMGETGMMIAMILGYAFLFIGIGIFMEGWRELHRAREENRLVTVRLYGLVRHPQYTGLFLALFGEGVVHWPTIFSVALFPVIVLAYYLLARSEERKVEEQFGDAYRVYRGRVPMFIPSWGQWRAMTTTRSESSNDSSPDIGFPTHAYCDAPKPQILRTRLRCDRPGVLPWLHADDGHRAARGGGDFLQQPDAWPRRGAGPENQRSPSQVALGLVTTFSLGWLAGVLIAGIYNLSLRMGK